MEVKKHFHGVVRKFGMVRWTLLRESSMYIRSEAVMVGCRQGFSKESQVQKTYHIRPKTPVIYNSIVDVITAVYQSSSSCVRVHEWKAFRATFRALDI